MVGVCCWFMIVGGVQIWHFQLCGCGGRCMNGEHCLCTHCLQLQHWIEFLLTGLLHIGHSHTGVPGLLSISPALCNWAGAWLPVSWSRSSKRGAGFWGRCRDRIIGKSRIPPDWRRRNDDAVTSRMETRGGGVNGLLTPYPSGPLLRRLSCVQKSFLIRICHLSLIRKIQPP